MEKFAKIETKLKRKKTVKNETETGTEKYFTTEVTLLICILQLLLLIGVITSIAGGLLS